MLYCHIYNSNNLGTEYILVVLQGGKVIFVKSSCLQTLNAILQKIKKQLKNLLLQSSVLQMEA